MKDSCDETALFIIRLRGETTNRRLAAGLLHPKENSPGVYLTEHGIDGFQGLNESIGGELGLIINPRGTGGSGKTELARRIIADYRRHEVGALETVHRTGRERPIGYRLRHPRGGRPLFVIGHYERTSGGCDTIRAADGGLDEVFRLADMWASSGHDVLLEGSALSSEHVRSSLLAERHRMHVLFLSTSVEQSARNLATRRRLRRSDWTLIARTVRAQRQTVEAACRRIRGVAEIEQMEFETALNRARGLLGSGEAG